MSVRLENGSVLSADYKDSDERVQNLPVSVQCWLYVPQGAVPGASAFWPVWTLGEPDAQNFLALEARRDQSDPAKLQLDAVFDGGTRTVAGVGDVETGAWHLVTVVLVAVGQTGNAEVRLYVDDLSVVKQTGAQGSLSPSDWTLFSLGQTLEQSGTPEDPTVHVEHPAVWRDELQDGTPQTSDAGKMYADKIPPWQAATRLTSGTGAPDFGYWFLTAHSRSGLRVRNDQRGQSSGDLYNEALPDDLGRPYLQWAESGSNAIWSARTPILRWVYDQPITPDTRPPFVAPSRLQPAFFVVNDNADEATAQEIRGLPIFSDPNITKAFGGDYLSSNAAEPIYLGVTVNYVPTKDVSLTAKRCADFVEMQGFTVGRGVGPGNRYAGALQIRGPGNAGIKGGVLRGYDRGMFRDQETAADTIPLELNIADWVDPGSTPNDYVLRPWHTWYRASGVELLAEYMDHLWAALKQELDDRGLCYPFRVHMDYETIPRETQHLRLDRISFGGQEVEIQTGTWPKVVADATRYQNEVIAYAYDSSGSEVTRTLQQLSPPASDPTKAFYDQSQAFIDWWWNWSYVTRMQAAADSVFASLNAYFEEARWGNYFCFTADDPDYPYVEAWDDRAFNSAADGVIRGDFSTPVLYSNPAWVDRIRGEHGGRIGYTVPESVRDVAKMRIDACANSVRKLPMAPTFEDPFRKLSYGAGNLADRYEFVEEDLREVYAYAWQRGADEFLLFNFGFPSEPGEPTPEGVPFQSLVRSANVAQWLRDTVHATAQYHQDHAARTGRLARRSM